jgi:flagella basal body P-ring formation protein FlgA
MTKLLVLLLALMLLALPGSGHALTQLKPSVTVTGNVVRIGDLFTDTGSSATEAVAPAPALGTRATYSAVWLGAIAREHRLDWSPSSDFDQVTVERASRAVGADLVAQRLLKAMPASVTGLDAAISLDNANLRFLVPAEAPDDMDVDGLTLDQRTGRFSAVVSAPPGAPDAQRQRITGKLIIEVTIAVPNRIVAINEILGRGDVAQIKVPRERLAADVVTDPAQLIGKSARHMLRAEQPLRAGDIQEPLVVHRGDLVTIELRTAVMQLGAQGKALEDGALGATVRVVNTQSNRTIDAIVAGANLVRAGASDKFAAR